MGTRLYNGVVVVFWMTTMGWLMVDKVWPTLRVGDPPNYRSIVERPVDEPPVCWAIEWGDHPVGFAASSVERRDSGVCELHSRVFIGNLPIDQLAPAWLGAIVKPMLLRHGRIDMDAKSRLEIDPLGRLTTFESRVRLASIRNAVHMLGTIDGNRLKLSIRYGELTDQTERYLPPEAVVGDALAPQDQLHGLRVGQRWTTPVYSPFRPPKSPMEVLEATVERQEPIFWNGQPVSALVVVYRNDSGLSLMNEPRGKLWVRDDGMVLRQQLTMFNSNLAFTRLAPDRSQVLFTKLEDFRDNDQEIPPPVVSELLQLVERWTNSDPDAESK